MHHSDQVKRVTEIAQALARQYYQQQYGPAHLLMALLHNDIGIASVLVTAGHDIHYLREWAEVRMEILPKSMKASEDPLPDQQIGKIFALAELVAMQRSQSDLDAFSLLVATLKPELGFTSEQLRTFPLTDRELLQNDISGARVAKPAPDGSIEPVALPSSAISALEKYCINKTLIADAGKLDPIIGRERETRMIAEVLGRRSKPNVILIGEPGVGKTALVDGFTLNILSGKIPQHLQNATVFELDLGTLVAGASYKGEIEDRIKSIIKEIKQRERAILFVDEIHILLDPKGSVGSGVAQLLKPELARGELTVIGATTIEEYRKYVEADEAFSRRFETIKVDEPDPVIAARMIRRLLPRYEAHHNIRLGDGVIDEAVRLSKRYVKDRRLPDAAIDLIDRTMAAIRAMDETSAEEINDLRNEFEGLSANAGNLPENELVKELRWFWYLIKNKVSHILLQQIDSETEPETLETSEALLAFCNKILNELVVLASVKRESVEKQDVAAIISGKTGIPLGKLQSSERERLLNMEAILQKRVVGQDHAVKALCEAILESRSGLIKAGQPIGSFFMLGPTGTGKTELAKSVAHFLFNDESFLIRFDMSEFKEEHSAALLYGAPPGYVGYEEGGMLVNKIRQNPYSVVLFDEIEKAHPSVFDIFLQILDEGKIHDRLGKEGDFSNAVILFTSNIGSEFIINRFQEDIIPKSSELLEIMSRHFRPEFLARLTEILPFAPISEQNVVKIFDIHLTHLHEQLSRQGIELTISDDAKKQLATTGFTPQYGARPLKGVIRNQLRRPISRMIVSEQLIRGNKLAIDLKEEELDWLIS